MSNTALQSFSNHFLIAMPDLQDPNFSQTVTLICQHDKNGALGVVINRAVKSININDLLERFSFSKLGSGKIGQQPIYVGGPVHTELGLVLHQDLGNWESTLKVSRRLGLTSSRDVLDAIANSSGPEDCMLLLGYAGWGAGQLDLEIQKNAWLTVPADPRIIFEVEVERRWAEAAISLGINITTLNTGVGHA